MKNKFVKNNARIDEIIGYRRYVDRFSFEPQICSEISVKRWWNEAEILMKNDQKKKDVTNDDIFSLIKYPSNDFLKDENYDLDNILIYDSEETYPDEEEPEPMAELTEQGVKHPVPQKKGWKEAQPSNNIPRTPVPLLKRCAQELKQREEVRMQEIEKYLIQAATFRKINGFLCQWNGQYYRQLDSMQFSSTVRNLLPAEAENKISRFNRFKEAYNFMLINEELDQFFTEKEIIASKSMIAFQNGLYDGKTGEWQKLSPKYPILFNINAKYQEEEEPETPYMDSIILSTTGGDEDVLLLFYQVLGYLFSQGTQAKKFFIFATAPDSGKSIIGEFLGRMLGEDNISAIALNDLGQRFALGNIGKIALNYNMDLPSATLDKNAVQKIKLLTGDPRIECEEKFVQSRTVVHHCKFLFASNHPIQLKEDDEAFYQRIVLIPFLYSITDDEKDYQLPDKLWKERHAIATKAAHAYRELCENNFVFHTSQMADEILASWRGGYGQSLLDEFWNHECIYYPDDDKSIFTPTEELFQAYKLYCERRGVIIEDKEISNFSRQFHAKFNVEKGKKRVKGKANSVHVYYGVRLAHPEE